MLAMTCSCRIQGVHFIRSIMWNGIQMIRNIGIFHFMNWLSMIIPLSLIMFDAKRAIQRSLSLVCWYSIHNYKQLNCLTFCPFAFRLFVAHSQGTTTLMAMLSELPEYNQYIAAASLMAPVGYLGNSGVILTVLSRLSPILKVRRNTSQLLPIAYKYS